MDEPGILLVGRRGRHTNLLYRALSTRYPTKLVYEDPPSSRKLARWRIRNVGLPRFVGQALFHYLVAKPLELASEGRRQEILASGDLSDAPPGSPVETVPSINHDALAKLIGELSPRMVVINGTRIATENTLRKWGVPVLNVHAGITPQYRGVHGAYWALVEKDRAHCGVTVHLVDAGLDTGPVLHQSTIYPGPRDNFSTYPWLQATVGCKLLIRAVEEVAAGTAQPVANREEGRRWYHPTIGEYLWYRLTKGVK